MNNQPLQKIDDILKIASRIDNNLIMHHNNWLDKSNERSNVNLVASLSFIISIGNFALLLVLCASVFLKG